MQNTHTNTHTHIYIYIYIYIFIRGILYVVSTPTFFDALPSSLGILILLLCYSYKNYNNEPYSVTNDVCVPSVLDPLLRFMSERDETTQF